MMIDSEDARRARWREWEYRYAARPETIADLPTRAYHLLCRIGLSDAATAQDVRPLFPALCARQSGRGSDRITDYGGPKTLAVIAVWLAVEAVRDHFNGFYGEGLA